MSSCFFSLKAVCMGHVDPCWVIFDALPSHPSISSHSAQLPLSPRGMESLATENPPQKPITMIVQPLPVHDPVENSASLPSKSPRVAFSAHLALCQEHPKNLSLQRLLFSPAAEHIKMPCLLVFRVSRRCLFGVPWWKARRSSAVHGHLAQLEFKWGRTFLTCATFHCVCVTWARDHACPNWISCNTILGTFTSFSSMRLTRWYLNSYDETIRFYLKFLRTANEVTKMGVSVISGAISSDSWRQRFWMNTSISTYCILLLSCLVILEKQSHLHQRLVQHYSWCFCRRHWDALQIDQTGLTKQLIPSFYCWMRQAEALFFRAV